MTAPRGLGLFLSSGDVRAPDRAAAECGACGAKWAAVFVEGPLGGRAELAKLDAFPSALEHYGVAPFCWTYPHPDSWDEAIARLRVVWRRVRWAGPPILDIETGPDGVRWSVGAIARMLEAAKDMDPIVTLWDRRYAVGLRGVELVMLQCYKRAAMDPRLEQEIAWWRGRGHVVVPLVGTFLGDENRLRADLHNAMYDPQGNARSVGVWCLRTTNARERGVLREVGDIISSSPT